MPKFAHIVGWGKYVPERVLTNRDLEEMVDTSDEWIRTRTGIQERRIASAVESTATMATNAAREALATANVDPLKVDLIIVATTTPDYFFPSTACLVQDALGAAHAAAYDLSAACSGFIYGVSMARDSIMVGSNQYVLVIGAETFSRIVNWRDRNTCVLFGDGAGAVLLAAGELPGGVLATSLGADGSGSDLLIVPAGGSRQPASQETVAQELHTVQMKGSEVFRFATRVMSRAAKDVAKRADVPLDDIELLIPHQANSRIIETAAKSLKLSDDRVYSNLHRYGNTSAASIPIALCEAVEEKRVQPGDHLILVGFGAGLTWGAALIQWDASISLAPLSWWKRTWLSLRYRWAKVESFFRRTWRWTEGLTKTPMGHTRILWFSARDQISKAGNEIGKARRGIQETGKDLAEKDSNGIGKTGHEPGRAAGDVAGKVGREPEKTTKALSEKTVLSQQPRDDEGDED